MHVQESAPPPLSNLSVESSTCCSNHPSTCHTLNRVIASLDLVEDSPENRRKSFFSFEMREYFGKCMKRVLCLEETDMSFAKESLFCHTLCIVHITMIHVLHNMCSPD